MAITRKTIKSLVNGVSASFVFDNYAKITHDSTASLSFDDAIIGESKDYGRFVLLLNTTEKYFTYCPNADVEWIAPEIEDAVELGESILTEYTFEKVTNKKGNREYYRLKL